MDYGLNGLKRDCEQRHSYELTYAMDPTTKKWGKLIHDFPKREGRWTPEEELYTKHLISAFKQGFLTYKPTFTSVRLWLAYVLNCSPMRITKKFSRGELRGPIKFGCEAHRFKKLSIKTQTKRIRLLISLREKFAQRIAMREAPRVLVDKECLCRHSDDQHYATHPNTDQSYKERLN